MKIGFYRNNSSMVGSIQKAIWNRLEPLGHKCVIVFRGGKVPEDLDVFSVWNGEKNSMKGMVAHVQSYGGLNIFCELGYIRRKSAWQLDLCGINAASSNHYWDSFPEPANSVYDQKLVANIREAFRQEHGIQYEEPKDYVLVILQTNTDVNITKYLPRYMNMGRLVSDVKFAMKPFPKLKLVFREHPKVAGRKGETLPPLSSQINKCRFIITINSNTAHEAMIANKDVIALGPHIYTHEKRNPGNGGVVFYCKKRLDKIKGFVEACEARIESGEAQNDPIRDRYLRYVWDREWTFEEIRNGPELLDLIQGRPKKLRCTVEMQPKWDELCAGRFIARPRLI